MFEELKAYLRRAKKANLFMVGINIAVFIIFEIMGDTQSTSFMFSHGACYAPAVMEGEYWRLFTSMFLHFGAVHLVFNMVCLIAMGEMLETIVGTWRYLVIYVIGGLTGNILSTAWAQYSGSNAVSAGASGAIFAVVGAVFVKLLRNRKSVGRDKITRITMMVVLMVIEGFTQAGTDNVAHIGGLLAGMLLGVLL